MKLGGALPDLACRRFGRSTYLIWEPKILSTTDLVLCLLVALGVPSTLRHLHSDILFGLTKKMVFHFFLDSPQLILPLPLPLSLPFLVWQLFDASGHPYLCWKEGTCPVPIKPGFFLLGQVILAILKSHKIRLAGECDVLGLFSMLTVPHWQD